MYPRGGALSKRKGFGNDFEDMLSPDTPTFGGANGARSAGYFVDAGRPKVLAINRRGKT